MKTDDVVIAVWVWLLLCVLPKVGCDVLYCEIHDVCELDCSVTHNSSNVLWKKYANYIIFDGTIGISKYPDKYAVTDNGRNLKIRNTTSSDEGKYACEATDSGFRSHDVIVELIDPPHVSIVDFHNGTLKCNASGFPDKYSYNVWEHQSLFGEHIRFLNGSADGYINVTSNSSYPTYQNNGIYKCLATNRVQDRKVQQYQQGEQRVIFEEKPVYVTEAHQIIYGNVGERVMLSVTFLSIPDFTKVYWLKSEGMKEVDSEKHYQINSHFNISLKIYESVVTIEGYNSSLAIKNIQKGDDCHYTVVVINPLGEKRCTVQLVLGFIDDATKFIILTVVGSVAAVAILLMVMCIVCWMCKKAATADATCDEDRYEQIEYKRKPKSEQVYEELVPNHTSEDSRCKFASTDNVV